MSNSFGHLFRITTFGESHGGGVGVVIDGCPPAYSIDLGLVQSYLDRRRPGQSPLTSPRQETDRVECLSGLEDGVTLGTPLTLLVRNHDARPTDYNKISNVFRPSHADYTTQMKYGIAAKSGGGRASARETIGRVAAAAVAEQILTKLIPDFAVVAFVDSIKDIKTAVVPSQADRAAVETHPLRCPDYSAAVAMADIVTRAQAEGDTVGGTIVCSIRQCPLGLGEPVFDKLEADLAKAMLSLPACRGFEIGSGFAATKMFGSEHNDAYYSDRGHIRTRTNNSGGVQGGISDGEEIYFRVAFKPVSTIAKPQSTVDWQGNTTEITVKVGRHDPCVLPRAVPIVEAMATLVIMDHWLRQQVNRLVGGRNL